MPASINAIFLFRYHEVIQVSVSKEQMLQEEFYPAIKNCEAILALKFTKGSGI